jgi:hypothetical protein
MMESYLALREVVKLWAIFAFAGPVVIIGSCLAWAVGIHVASLISEKLVGGKNV